MTKEKIKNYLDLLPFVILILSAFILVWTVATTDRVFMWKHIVGFFFLPIIYLAFRWRHKVGVLVLGLTILIGLLSLLSYSSSVTTTTLSIGKNEDSQIPVFYGQPIFLLWLSIHLIVSSRHYLGIGTKKYWQHLLVKSVKETPE